MSAAVLGLHAVKARWVDSTIRDGLNRPSGAWFMFDSRTSRSPEPATFAAAVYLALAPRGRALLAAGRPGRPIHQVFERQPELLPCLLAFHDAPTGYETTHCYAWLGGRMDGTARVTEPYTKVERAGRTVGTPLPLAARIAITERDVADSPIGRLACGPEWADDVPLLRRIERGDPGGADEPGRGSPNLIAELCLELGHLLRARWTRCFPDGRAA